MKIIKKAIKNLQHKIAMTENQRLDLLDKLNQNPEFNSLYSERKNYIIEKAKAEFDNIPFDNCLLKNCESKLKKFLKSNDLNLNVLQPTVLCKKCNDNFYIDNKPCTCLNAELAKLLREESGLKSFAKFEDSNFEIFSQSEKIKKIYTSLQKWCDNPLNSQLKNFGFFGKTGTGKTFLIECMADKLIKNGYFVYYTTAFNLNKNLLQYHTENNNELLEKFLVCDFLFIDDLGTENFIKNFTENYLYTIINQRIINNQPIIFNTNLEMNELFDRYGERIFSRLINKSCSKCFLFDDNDLRLKK